MDLFDKIAADRLKRQAPLADRMRPRNLDEFVGQEEIVGPGGFFRDLIERGKVPSLILWGPPGSGKTTLAKIIAESSGKHFDTLSAVSSGVKDVRRVIDDAKQRLKFEGRGTLLFIDEIHRFNKAQQDAFLPHVEDGTVVLIGATTENPSFEVISPLLSRAKTLTLRPLSDEEIGIILRRALDDGERGLGGLGITASEQMLSLLANLSSGDARVALNILELSAVALADRPEGERHLESDLVLAAAQRRGPIYDKAGEEHFNIISALHKSMRGSDPDASLYWLARMLEAGEEPLYVARRIVRFASEDVGNADPHALPLAVAAMQAVDLLGMPEGNLALAQAVLYLALAPKSNSVYRAYGRAKRDVRERPSYPVPLHIRNAPTKLMSKLGYGEGYLYPHDFKGAIVDQTYFPPELEATRYYHPTPRGFEGELARRFERIRRIKEERGESRKGEAKP
jgi:putative ATPase